MPLKIAIVVGSLRAGSFNRRLALALAKLPQGQGHGMEIVEIGDLPLYNQDDDASPSAAVTRLKAAIRAADGVIFVTPEYNRSIPGVLKNALDHASRPYGDSAWARKPAAIIGTSQGGTATSMAQQHLRGVLAYLDMVVLTQPEAYIQWHDDLIGADGAIGAKSAEFLGTWLDAFLALAQAHQSPDPAKEHSA